MCHHIVSSASLALFFLAHHYRLLSYWSNMQSSNERICPHWRMCACVIFFQFRYIQQKTSTKEEEKERTLFLYIVIFCNVLISNILNSKLAKYCYLFFYYLSCLSNLMFEILIARNSFAWNSFIVCTFITFACNYETHRI